MKPWFRLPEESLMPVTLRVDQFGTQLRADGTHHGAKTIKSTHKVLTNTGIAGEENSKQLKLISMRNKKRKAQLGQLSEAKSRSPRLGKACPL